VEIEASDWLVLHFGMTGTVTFYEDRDNPPEYSVLRVDLKNSKESMAVISKRELGRIDLTGSPGSYLEDHDIGRDVLRCNKEVFVETLGKKRGSIKSALMDESTFSGVGNIYSDEILFQCGVHPNKKVNRMDPGALKELFDAMRSALKEAIDAGADPDRMPDHFLITHREPRGKCPKCKGRINKKKISGRSS